jgi:EPS-associated MarR family transcriptional regulator
MDSEEVRYRLLDLIEQRPGLTQREAAAELGISIGKVNYCLKALIERDHVKLNNFRGSPEKLKYRYLLTPSGVEEKSHAALSFLHQKIQEYERLQAEIEHLIGDVKNASEGGWGGGGA